MAKWSDNFDDNYLDPAKWEKVEVYGHMYERNMRAEFSCPMGNCCAGIVSRDRYNLIKGKVSIYLASIQCYAIALQLSNEKVTTDFPSTTPNAYIIFMNRCYRTTGVYRNVGGRGKTLYEGNWQAASNKFKIEIEAAIVRFWEGDRCVYSEPYQLPSYECYIHIYSISDRSVLYVYYGTDWADDFDCEFAETTEEITRASEEARQTAIAEWVKENWLPLTVLGVILAIMIAVVLMVWR